MSTKDNPQNDSSADPLHALAHKAMDAVKSDAIDAPGALGARAFARLVAAEKADDEHQEAVLRKALEALPVVMTDAPAGLAARTAQRVFARARGATRFMLLRSQWFKGLVAASVMFFAAVVNLPALADIAQRPDMEDACAGNLYALGNLLHCYKEKYGSYPYVEGKSLLSALRESDMEVFMDMIASPMSRDLDPYQSVVCDVNAYPAELAGALPVAWTPPGMHRNGQRVLFLSGRVDLLSEDELAQALRVYSLVRDAQGE